MLSKRCKLVSGLVGLGLLLVGSSPAFAQQATQLTPSGAPSGDSQIASNCAPWCNDVEVTSNQSLNSQDVTQSQQDSQPSDNGSNGNNDCDFSLSSLGL